MTGDEMIRISKRYLKGIATGLGIAVLIGLTALIIFWPKLHQLPDQPVPVPTAPAAAPPAFLGVPADFKEVGDRIQSAYKQPFQAVAPGIEAQDNARENVRLYEACPNLWPGPQETGDCVSMGKTNTDYCRLCVKALKIGLPPPKSQLFQPYCYGTTRVQIGRNSIPCRSAGAYPSDAIKAGQQFGYVFNNEAGELGYQYSGSLADKFGCNGPSADLLAIGKKRAGGDAYPIRSVDEWRDAIVNGYPCTVAIPWTPGRTYRSADGRSCFSFDGRKLGGHQICSLAYDGSSGEPYWLLFNSHGASWPAGASHADGTPPGSVWVDQRWAEWIVRNGELWAISDVPGFEADKLDLHVFDDLRVSRATSPVPPVLAP